MMFILTQLDPKYHLDIAEAQMGTELWLGSQHGSTQTFN